MGEGGDNLSFTGTLLSCYFSQVTTGNDTGCRHWYYHWLSDRFFLFRFPFRRRPRPAHLFKMPFSSAFPTHFVSSRTHRIVSPMTGLATTVALAWLVLYRCPGSRFAPAGPLCVTLCMWDPACFCTAPAAPPAILIDSLIYEAVFSMSETWKISSIQLHLQQSYCTLKLLDFFQDVTWHLTLDFALIWA